MPPRTIDNLGVDVSTRYAEDQKIFDQSFIKESGRISAQTAIDVTIPFNPSEVEQLFKTSPLQHPWASFSPPPAYAEQRKWLFTFQVIPSLGTDEKREAQVQKIAAKKDTLETEEREKKVLTSALATLTQLDKLSIDINSRRGQYHKG